MSSPSPRVLLAVVPLALLVGLVAWLVLHESDDAVGEDVEVGRSDAAEPRAGQARLAPFSAPDEGDVAPEPARVDAAPGRVDAAEVAVDPGVETITLLAGTVVLFEDDGTRVEDPSGNLRIAIGRNGGIAKVETVDVEDGRFEVTRRLGADGAVLRSERDSPYPAPLEELECTVSRFEVPGRGPMVFCDPGSRELIGSTRSFAAGTTDAMITVRPAPGLTLHVVDALTAAPLTGVEVQGSAGIGDASKSNPRGTAATQLATDATSPVSIGPLSGLHGRRSVTVFARADGYAWRSISVAKRDPGERTIELSPAGALEVKLLGEVPRRAYLRLRDRESDDLDFEVRLRGKDVERFEGLPPGSYEVVLQLGKRYDNPLELARETAEVLVGPATTVTMPVPEVGPVEVADIEGRLVLPAAWDDDDPRLRLVRVSPSRTGVAPEVTFQDSAITRVEGTADVFRFERSSLETGDYRLEYAAGGARLEFELPPTGRDDLVLEVRPPADVTVQVVDAGTGLDAADVDEISWRALGLDEGPGGPPRSVDRHPVTGLFALRVPSCSISLSVYGELQGQRTVPLATDGLHVRLEVRARPTASVVLRSGDAVVPWPGFDLVDVEPVDGEGQANSWTISDTSRSFGVSLPGRYRITIPTIDGFHPHEPVEVDLVAGEPAQVVVELVPK